MVDHHARTYTLTLPDEATARAVADRLAERGHRLVAVRIVDHFTFDPKSFWYGKPSIRPEYAGWWDVFSVVHDPAAGSGDDRLTRAESAAVATIARQHGGTASGPGGGHLDTVLRVFSREGLVHDLDAGTARQRRANVLAEAPPPTPAPPPPPGLRYVAEQRGRSELLAVAEVAQQPAGDGDDVTDLLAELFDEAMHQDTCYPWTASRVPTLAALATDARLSDRHRASLLIDLYLIATVGRRDLAATADSRHALGRPPVEPPDARAARAAVAAAVPAIAARTGESELIEFLVAALAAACPEAADGGTHTLTARYAGTARAPVAALIHGLAVSDPEAVDAALDELAAGTPDAFDGLESPHAQAGHRAVAVLADLLIAELSRATG